MGTLRIFSVGATNCVLDNSANSHIWNKKLDFVPGSIRALNHFSSVATIGGSNFYPTGIGNVRVRIKDDSNKISEIILKDVLFFPNSQVNIISIVCLADQFDDDHGTSVHTDRNGSIFTWDRGSYVKTSSHSKNGLPEITVNEGLNSETGCKIRNLIPASAFFTYNSKIPQEKLDRTVAIIDVDNLASYFSKSNRKDDNRLVRTDNDDLYNEGLKRNSSPQSNIK